jgi:nucleotide-binding universal stress UspA family protein
MLSSPRRILIATDFSAGSDEALTQAIALAKQPHAELEIVYVMRARDTGAELVVGTHSRTGLAHMLLGSVAEKIVRRSTCPVLTVPFSKKAA